MRARSGIAIASAFVLGATTITAVPVSATATAFISKWNTWNTGPGSTAFNQLKLPLVDGGTYDFSVDWGDGTVSSIDSASDPDVMHTYDSGQADVTVKITGQLEGWSFNNTGDRNKLSEISQWGSLKLGNTGGYFYGAQNLAVTATDTPDLSGTTNLSRAFYEAFGPQDDGQPDFRTVKIGNWDTSNVTNMSMMFGETFSFNTDLSAWNTSNVTNLSGMFRAARAFSQPLASWNVSKVEDFSSMFIDTTYNQPLGSWNTASAKNLSYMFKFNTDFNQNLAGWNVSGATNVSQLFHGSLSTANYDALLNGWAGQAVQPGLTLDVGNTKNSGASAAAKGVLTATRGWTINDAGGPVTAPATPSSPGSSGPLKRQEALIKVPIPKKLPKRGERQILLPKTLTTAGNKVKIKVTGKQFRNGKRLFRVFTVKSGKDKGKTILRTYGRSVKITLTWSAAATAEFAPFHQSRTYRV